MSAKGFLFSFACGAGVGPFEPTETEAPLADDPAFPGLVVLSNLCTSFVGSGPGGALGVSDPSISRMMSGLGCQSLLS